MTITDWAARHGVSAAALAELTDLLDLYPPAPTVADNPPHSEAYVQQHIRLAASARESVLLLRNNSGAFEDATGRVVRYGLGNDSKRVNEEFKSSDLIGGTPVLITPHHVGMRVLVFTAVEVKAEDWKPGKDKKREAAQGKFLNVVQAAGGIGMFAHRADQYIDLLDRFGVPMKLTRKGG